MATEKIREMMRKPVFDNFGPQIFVTVQEAKTNRGRQRLNVSLRQERIAEFPRGVVAEDRV